MSYITVSSTDFKHTTNMVMTADGEHLGLRRIHSVKVSSGGK